MIVRSRFFFLLMSLSTYRIVQSTFVYKVHTLRLFVVRFHLLSAPKRTNCVCECVCVCVWLDKFIIVLIIELQYINLGAGVFPLNCMYIVCLSVPIILSLQFANYIRIILESLVLYRKRWSFSFLFIIILIIILFGYTTAGIIWLKCFSWYFLISFCWKFMFFMYVYRQCTVSWFFFSSNSI